jgi:hypothetical protein
VPAKSRGQYWAAFSGYQDSTLPRTIGFGDGSKPQRLTASKSCPHYPNDRTKFATRSVFSLGPMLSKKIFGGTLSNIDSKMSVDSTSPTQKVDPTIGLCVSAGCGGLFRKPPTDIRLPIHQSSLIRRTQPKFVGNVVALASDELRLGRGRYRVY